MRTEARRLILEALRNEWKPKVRALIEHRSAVRRIPWGESCDSAEFDIVTSSEELKMAAEAGPHDEDRETGWELSAQAMLDIIAEVRAERAHEGTR